MDCTSFTDDTEYISELDFYGWDMESESEIESDQDSLQDNLANYAVEHNIKHLKFFILLCECCWDASPQCT